MSSPPLVQPHSIRQMSLRTITVWGESGATLTLGDASPTMEAFVEVIVVAQVERKRVGLQPYSHVTLIVELRCADFRRPCHHRGGDHSVIRLDVCDISNASKFRCTV